MDNNESQANAPDTYRERQRDVSKSVVMFLCSIASIPAVYLVIQFTMFVVASSDGPPNQSAMVIGFLVFIVWSLVAMVVAFLALMALCVAYTRR